MCTKEINNKQRGELTEQVGEMQATLLQSLFATCEQKAIDLLIDILLKKKKSFSLGKNYLP